MKITAVAAAFAPALVLASPRAAGLASPPDTEDALSPRDAHAPEHKLMSRDPNIRNSCKPLMLSDTDHMTISALCLNGQNQYQHSRVILNHCLRNNEGQLEKFRNGGFDASCKMLSCRLSGYDYTCACPATYSNPYTTTIDLSTVLYNNWGRLGC